MVVFNRLRLLERLKNANLFDGFDFVNVSHSLPEPASLDRYAIKFQFGKHLEELGGVIESDQEVVVLLPDWIKRMPTAQNPPNIEPISLCVYWEFC